MIKKLMILTSISLMVVAGLIVAQSRIKAADRVRDGSSGEFAQPDDHWQIKGALSEACTCNVPCTCNFGQGPSPYSYCYAVYAYGIREGNFNGVNLDGLKFGGMETAKGNAMYVDARAEGEQRAALEAVARKVLRVSGDRMGHGKLLGIKYVEIKQEYDDRQAMLDLGGAGGFKTYYIMGRDKTKPVVVLNNTEWAIDGAIKGKTEYLIIKDDYGNRHSAKNTNSNQGDFEYDEQTNLGGISCGASCSTGEKGDAKTHKH
jgi:Protein of unknown function (DUF1326)